MMPEMDGLATFKSCTVTAHIPVILLTAKVQSTDRQRFAELGLTAMIAKPFNPLNLASQVADALGWS